MFLEKKKSVNVMFILCHSSVNYSTGSSSKCFYFTNILFRAGNCGKQTWTYRIYPERDDLELEGNYSDAVSAFTDTQITHREEIYRHGLLRTN